MDKIYKGKEKEIITFFKEAFCINGEVKIIEETNNLKIEAVIELNDLKRGKFYIGLLKKEIIK